MSAAELLRKAAETVRRQPVLGTREMSLAIADWLDSSAQEVDNTTDALGDDAWINPDWAALAVARLIVGEDA